MSLNEQYSDEEQRSSKHDKLSSYKFDNYYMYKLSQMYMTSTNGEIYMSRTMPCAFFPTEYYEENRETLIINRNQSTNISALS